MTPEQTKELEEHRDHIAARVTSRMASDSFSRNEVIALEREAFMQGARAAEQILTRA